jgi:hypothetical protein
MTFKNTISCLPHVESTGRFDPSYRRHLSMAKQPSRTGMSNDNSKSPEAIENRVHAEMLDSFVEELEMRPAMSAWRSFSKPAANIGALKRLTDSFIF